MEREGGIKVRFPNESFYDQVHNFDINEFELRQIFQFEVYGKWNDIFIFIDIEDYKRITDDKTDGQGVG